VRHRLVRHQELPVQLDLALSFIEERRPAGDVSYRSSRVQLERRSEIMERLNTTGPRGSFYLSAFVKKFTYSVLVRTSNHTDKPTDLPTRILSGAGRNDHRGRMTGGARLLSVGHGGEQRKQNVDGRGLVFRRRRAAFAAMPARIGPDRPDSQLPIEEELYG
jgi:hypothetical protein